MSEAPQRSLRILGTAEEIRAVGELGDHRRDELLTVPQAAERLNISATTAYALAAKGHLPTIRFPGSRIVRVSARALERLIDQQVGHLYRDRVEP